MLLLLSIIPVRMEVGTYLRVYELVSLINKVPSKPTGSHSFRANLSAPPNPVVLQCIFLYDNKSLTYLRAYGCYATYNVLELDDRCSRKLWDIMYERAHRRSRSDRQLGSFIEITGFEQIITHDEIIFFVG